MNVTLGHREEKRRERETERERERERERVKWRERRVKGKVTHLLLPCVCVKANCTLMVPSSNCNYVIFLHRM